MFDSSHEKGFQRFTNHYGDANEKNNKLSPHTC